MIKNRFLLMLLIAVLFIPSAYSEGFFYVGQEIEFGMYEQDNVTGNGKEPIEWVILSVDNNQRTVLAVSKYILDCQVYNKTMNETIWKQSSIRNWLNTSFYNSAFSPQEKNAIVPTTVSNSLDQVFLLNGNQIRQLLPSDLCYATEYAKRQGVFVAKANSASSWWVQKDITSYYGAFVGALGSIYESANAVNIEDNGVRPAITLSLAYFFDDTPGAKLEDYHVNERITIDGWGTIKATQIQVLDKLGKFDRGKNGSKDQDFESFYDSKSSAQFIVLKMDILNTTNRAKNYLQNASVIVDLAGEYQFGGWSFQYNYANGQSTKKYVNEEDAGQQNKNYVIDPNDNFPIAPGETGHFCFGCTVPNAALETTESLIMTVTIDGYEIVLQLNNSL